MVKSIIMQVKIDLLFSGLNLVLHQAKCNEKITHKTVMQRGTKWAQSLNVTVISYNLKKVIWICIRISKLFLCQCWAQPMGGHFICLLNLTFLRQKWATPTSLHDGSCGMCIVLRSSVLHQTTFPHWIVCCMNLLNSNWDLPICEV